MRASFLAGVVALSVQATSAMAIPQSYSGFDAGAGSTDPRPNSNLAASSFDAAASALGTTSVITFESSAVGAFNNLTIAPGVTVTGIDAQGSSQTIRNSPSGTPTSLYGYNTTTSGANFISVYGGSLTFTFAIPISAFGAYFTGVQLANEVLQFDDGSSQSLIISYSSNGAVEFFGFTDAGNSISSITFNSRNDILGIDDVRYTIAAATAVPEPASLALLGMGVMGIAAVRRRRAG